MEVVPYKEPGQEADFDVTVTSKDNKTRHKAPGSFKEQYGLLESSGMRAQEPDEDEVGRIDWTKRSKRACLGQLITCLLLVSVSFITARLYCHACQDGYQEIAVFQNFGETFPVDEDKAEFIRERCFLGGNPVLQLVQSTFEQSQSAVQSHVEGGGDGTSDDVPGLISEYVHTTAPATTQMDPKCKVTDEQVENVCGNLPVGAHSPGIELNLVFTKVTVPCLQKTCRADYWLGHYDVVHVAFVLCVVLLYIMFSCAFDARIASMEKALFDADQASESKYDQMMAGGCSRLMRCS